MTNEMKLPEENKIVVAKIRPSWDIHNGTPYLAFAHIEDDGHGARWYTKNEDGYDCEISGIVIGWMDTPAELRAEMDSDYNN